MPFCIQKVDASSYSSKNGIPNLISVTQVAFDATLNVTAKHFRHKIWNIIGVILYGDSCFFDIPKKIRCVKHKQPEIAYRDSANATNPFVNLRLQIGCLERHNQNPSSKRSLAFCDFSSASNQYSSSSGPISVSTT